LTIFCLSDKEVRRYESNAFAAVSGKDLISASERPLRVRTGLLVMGEMVVIFSNDMMAVYVICLDQLDRRDTMDKD